MTRLRSTLRRPPRARPRHQPGCRLPPRHGARGRSRAAGRRLRRRPVWSRQAPGSRWPRGSDPARRRQAGCGSSGRTQGTERPLTGSDGSGRRHRPTRTVSRLRRPSRSWNTLNQPPACLNANSSGSLRPNSGPRSTATSDNASCGSDSERRRTVSASTSTDWPNAPAPLTSIGTSSASSAAA